MNTTNKFALLSLFALAVAAPTQRAAGASFVNFNWGTTTITGTSTQPFLYLVPPAGDNNWVPFYSPGASVVTSATWTDGTYTAGWTMANVPGQSHIITGQFGIGGDDGPQPLTGQGIYNETYNVPGLTPGNVQLSLALGAGLAPAMVLGIYDVVPSFLRLAAYDTDGNPVSLASVSTVFMDTTSFTANNPWSLNADGTFNGNITPIPTGAIDLAFGGLTGFDPTITRIDFIETRSQINDGSDPWGDGFSVYIGTVPEPSSAILIAVAGTSLLIIRRRRH